MTEPTHPGPERAGLLARLSNAAQLAGRRRGRGNSWIAAGMWLLVGGLVWAYFLAGALASLHRGVESVNQGRSAAGAAATLLSSGRATGLAVCFGLVASATLLYTHLAGGIAWASLGMRLRDGRRRIFGGAAGTVVLYAAAMLVADIVFHTLATSQGEGPRGYPGMATPDAQLLAGDITSSTFTGGSWEELTLLAIPVALFTALVPLETMERAGRCAWWSALVAALLAARWAIHLYYGWIPALQVLVWAAAAVGLFLASGTIWPLILAHSLYDAAAFTAARIPASNAAITGLFWTVAVTGAVIAAGTARRWRNRTRQPRQPNLLISGEGI